MNETSTDPQTTTKENARADLDVFRQQTRDWLEENCPQSMRTPQRSDNDACWGDATSPSPAKIRNSGWSAWPPWLDGARVAE
ncbi:hypothetical protein ULF88_12975 [Halopseudomonas pachastrellae]|nr:hypothetical protein [Halopseudomonas pachastrellae]